jgi:hypothetical protein
MQHYRLDEEMLIAILAGRVTLPGLEKSFKLEAIIVGIMPNQPKGFGHGGARLGAGRKRGGKNQRSKAAELVAKAKAEALTMPVDWLLERLNDPELGAEYRDKLAAIVAPYTAPRLSAVSITKPPAQMSDEEIAQLIGLTEEDMLRLGIGRDKWPHPVH